MESPRFHEDEYYDQFNDSSMIAATGVTSIVFFELCRLADFDNKTSPLNSRFDVFLLLYYLKLYPPQEGLQMTILGAQMNTSSVIAKMGLWADYLNKRINLIDYYWCNRFSNENILPHLFGTLVTGCVDSSAHQRTRTVFKQVRDRNYSGKHKKHCNKIQVVTDLQGRAIFVSGPHPGSDHDSVIWNVNNPWSRMHPEETFLGDKAYIGCPHVTGQFKKPRKPKDENEPNKQLSDFKSAWNGLHGFYRVVVEHCFGFAAVYGFIRQSHRGHIGLCENSISRYQKFVRFIFELRNLHWKLTNKIKRNLQPVLLNPRTGANLLPRMDDSDEMRILRARLHSRHGAFISEGMVIRQSHLETGYATSDFDLKQFVWYYCVRSHQVVRGQVWALTTRRDDRGSPYLSIRTSKGHYYNQLLPRMLIPCDRVCGTPPITSFILRRPFDNQSTCIPSFVSSDQPIPSRSKRPEKKLWEDIKHDKVRNNKKFFKIVGSASWKLSFGMQLRTRKEIRRFVEESDSDSKMTKATVEDLDYDPFDGTSESETDVSSESSYPENDESDLSWGKEGASLVFQDLALKIADFDMDFDINSVNKDNHTSSIRKSTASYSVSKPIPSISSSVLVSSNASTHHKRRQSIEYGTSAKKKQCIESECVVVEDTELKEKKYESSTPIRSWEERSMIPLIPETVVNVRLFLEECVFVSILCLNCARFPHLLSIFIFSDDEEREFLSCFLILALRECMYDNIVHKTIDASKVLGCLQVLKPQIFFRPDNIDKLSFVYIFEQILDSISIEEDFFYNNENYSSYCFMNVLSKRFNVSATIVLEEHSFFELETISEDKFNEFVYPKTESDRYLTLTIKIFRPSCPLENQPAVVGPYRVVIGKQPQNTFIVKWGVCNFLGTILFVNLERSFVVYVIEGKLQKHHVPNTDFFPLIYMNSEPVDFSRTCILLICELEFPTLFLYSYVDPFDIADFLQTPIFFSQCKKIDKNLFMCNGDLIPLVCSDLLNDAPGYLTDFLLTDILEKTFVGISNFLFLCYPVDFNPLATAAQRLYSQADQIVDVQNTDLILILRIPNHFVVVIVRRNEVLIMDSINFRKSEEIKVNLMLQEISSVYSCEKSILLNEVVNVSKEINKKKKVLSVLECLPKVAIFPDSSIVPSARKVYVRFPNRFTQSNGWSCGLNCLTNILCYVGVWKFPGQNLGLVSEAKDFTKKGILNANFNKRVKEKEGEVYLRLKHLFKNDCFIRFLLFPSTTSSEIILSMKQNFLFTEVDCSRACLDEPSVLLCTTKILNEQKNHPLIANGRCFIFSISWVLDATSHVTGVISLGKVNVFDYEIRTLNYVVRPGYKINVKLYEDVLDTKSARIKAAHVGSDVPLSIECVVVTDNLEVIENDACSTSTSELRRESVGLRSSVNCTFQFKDSLRNIEMFTWNEFEKVVGVAPLEIEFSSENTILFSSTPLVLPDESS